MGREDLPVPWKIGGMVEERVRFVVSVACDEAPIGALCAAYGISRETGHKWLKRWRESGVSGLQDGSRAPHGRPQALAPELAAALLAQRQARPHWGPRKLLAVLAAAQPAVAWPAASTVGDLLRRSGLVVARPRQRRGLPQTAPFTAAVAPNDEWAIDFKGWFRTADGQRCDPLTVSDTASRMLLECRIMPPRTQAVAAACEALFQAHGLPGQMRMDNGAPFGSTGPAGLTKLSIGWVKLGIRLALIAPGCPGQNGRHERMHGTLKQETAVEPAASPAAQQARFDAFRQDYNAVRPHEALGQVPPASLWRPSARRHPGRLEEPWYTPDHQVQRVRQSGELKWQGGVVYLGGALAGEPIGLLELPSGDWLARFMAIDLGVIDRRRAGT
jgi:putative transposase